MFLNASDLSITRGMEQTRSISMVPCFAEAKPRRQSVERLVPHVGQWAALSQRPPAFLLAGVQAIRSMVEKCGPNVRPYSPQDRVGALATRMSVVKVRNPSGTGCVPPF